MYRLLLTNSARKDLDRLQGTTWGRVRDALLELRDQPRPPGCKKLRGGPQAYRIRIGDYRAIYDIDDDDSSITILRVRHRRDVYRGL
jgi:mRNA interferase RelE/StbE